MSNAAVWWTEAQFEQVKQELARPTFRRSTLIRARDQANHDRSGNHLTNIDDTTHRQNSLNQTRRKNNTSGCMDVHYLRVDGVYEAFSFEAACAARKAAEREYGFHKRHGERRPAKQEKTA